MAEYPLLNALSFAALGVLVFLACFAVIDRMAPRRLWPEILERQNLALAVVLAAAAVGLGLIIAAAMH